MILLLPLVVSALVQPEAAKADPIADGGVWVKGHAIVPTTAEAGRGFEDLKGLGELVGDARIVSLGEPTHGTREAFQMKHRLLEYLVEEKGFSIFSIEANMPESYALNEYVIEGKGDPAKLIAGMYFWTWRTEEVLAMVEWMRGWNQRNPASGGKPRLQFTGFDMQTPDVAWGIGDAFIAEHAPELREKNRSLVADLRAVTMRASPGSTQGGFTSATGTFPVGAAKGKKLKFSAWIRTEGVSGWTGAWWRCDTAAGVNGFNNMADQKIKGTTEWTRREFTLDVPADVQNINFGFLLSGDGTAWFDDVEIELDGVKYADPAMFSLDFEDDAVKFLSGGSAEYAISRSATSPHGGAKCLEIRRRPESEVPKVDPAEVSARAEAVLAGLAGRRDELAKKAGAAATDWAIQNARVVAQCARMYAGKAGFNVRDECMAENVRWILDQNPGRKIVLWAHNGHVTRGPYFGMKPMGAWLAATHGKEMVVFGFTTGKGTYTAMAGGGGGLKHDHELAAPLKDSVESVFAASGLAAAIVDVRGAEGGGPGLAWAATARPMRSIGALATPMQFGPCTPGAGYDVLVWQAETTASRTLE